MRVRRLFTCAVAATALLAPTATAAVPDHHPTSLIVHFADGASSAQRAAIHGALGATVAARFGALGVDVVSLPDGLSPVEALPRYEARAGVLDASLNHVIRALAAPNDVLFKDQWGFHNTGQAVTGSLVRGSADNDIDAPEGWTTAFGSGFESAGGTRVAVIDTGIDRAHADLLGKVKACAQAVTGLGVVTEGACEDDNLHGTHTAGTVAANTGNSLGVAGTAPNAELAIFKFLNAGGLGFQADGIAGTNWAVNQAGARVLSMSYGSEQGSSAEQAAFKDAVAKGVLPVAAAGNGYDSTPNYPAFYNEVMSVAATNQAGAIAEFSTCNGDVEIAAPGEDIWSTFPANGYGVISGTSMSTPHVAGAAALVMSETGQTASQVRNTLTSTGVAVPSNGGRSYCGGYRQANLAAALGSGGGTTTPPPTASPGAITGVVTDQKSRSALASATVNCGSAGTATTGTDGRYTLSNVPAGGYTCTASKTGYASKAASVSVASGSTTTASFALRRQ